MTAIEEFSELEERLGFLTSAAPEDLEAGDGFKLRETIRRINRHVARAVRRGVRGGPRVVPGESSRLLVLRGGRADLRLEEGEDVLDCGIEILAQPPGKRLGSACSCCRAARRRCPRSRLLFAIFRYQPSPFCLLDEVDAALDETNVSRFTRTCLQEYAKNTQFVHRHAQQAVDGSGRCCSTASRWKSRACRS